MGSRAGNRPWLWQLPSLRMMELGNGVRLGLLQASLGDDHGALCRYRRLIGKREPVRVDATGRIVREAKVASEPEVLIGCFCSLGLVVTRIGLEAGPLSQWLYAGMRDAGLTNWRRNMMHAGLPMP